MRSVSALLLGLSLELAAVRPRAAGRSPACRVNVAMQALPISFLPLKRVAEPDRLRVCFFGMFYSHPQGRRLSDGENVVWSELYTTASRGRTTLC